MKGFKIRAGLLAEKISAINKYRLATRRIHTKTDAAPSDCGVTKSHATLGRLPFRQKVTSWEHECENCEEQSRKLCLILGSYWLMTCLAYLSAETSVNFYRNSRRHMIEYSTVQNHRCENLTSNKITNFPLLLD
jgi:hypothetical protein